MRPAPRAQARLLPDGRRLHLQDGPIDLIVEAAGEPAEVAAAYRAAASRFRFVLDELCSELAALRCASRAPARAFRTPVAQRMENAGRPPCGGKPSSRRWRRSPAASPTRSWP